ncbi:MAG: HAMP domain-containing protein [Nitrospiraceae bacterium]|nr:MAG: HAMP domain-containing protein [Nitrospiraceae bacterium]
MFNSVKVNIAVTALMIIAVIMILSTVRDIRATEQKLLAVQKEKATLLSDSISHNLVILMLKNQWQDLQSFMEDQVKESKELKGIRVFLPESGLIVASSEPQDTGGRIHEKDMQIFTKREDADAFLTEKEGQGFASKLTIILNQPVCHKCHGSEKEILGVLALDVSLASVNRTVQEFKREHYTDAIVAFLIMAGGILFVVSMLIDRPIKKMITAFRKIENGDLSARMEEDSGNEFGLMAKSFNSMVTSLEKTKKHVESYHLEQMQKAARLASLGEIISGIAHEIKNPLTGISCAVQIIQSEMKEGDSNREITAEILNQIKRLDRIVKDLLNYARPKPLSFIPYSMQDILEKSLLFVYPEANRQHISITTLIAKDIPEVLMDPDQMQQVFLNLMINAVQAMPAGGGLTISIRVADAREIGADIKNRIESDTILIVSFKDTGEGIEAEHRDSIFDPFFTRKTKGTGLGLSISQRIVQEHGGEITVISEVGSGSIFSILLPVMQSGKKNAALSGAI